MSINPDVEPVQADISNRLDAIIAEINSLDAEAEAIGHTLKVKRAAQSNLSRALKALGEPEAVKPKTTALRKAAKAGRKSTRPAPGNTRQDRVLALLADGREYTTRDIRAGINEHNDNSLTVLLGTLVRKGKITKREIRNQGELDPRVTKYNLWKIA